MSRLLLGAWIGICGIPVCVLGMLAVAGALAPGPAAAAAAAVLIGGLVVASAWISDLNMLRGALRHLATENRAALAHQVVRAARLPHMTVLAADIERVARTLADGAALVGRLQKADKMIVEALPDPLLVLGEDRAVRRANPAALAAFGTDMPAVLRQPALRGAIDRAYAQGVIQQTELSIPGVVTRELRASVIPLDPPLGDGGRAILVLSDRTHERAIERMRADFVANASHELRTPLASLIGFIDTLRGPARDDPPAQARFLAIMAEQAERMNRLIDDLLNLSRVELTEHQTPRGEVDLVGLAHRMLAELEPRVAARRITVATTLAEGLPLVRGDADQLAQVLGNLLDNAVKYGAEGGTLRLSVGAAAGEQWPAQPGLVLSVADDGLGIPKIEIPRLTERFYRVDKARSRAVGGTGLGLAIVKHIVNRHRGRLVIESEEGKGATFSVWLPVLAPRPVAEPEARQPARA